MDIAAQLAAHDAVGSIHIAVDKRPTYRSLTKYRKSAADSGLTLSVERSALVLRPESDSNGKQRADLPVQSKVRRFVRWLATSLMFTKPIA